MQQLRIVLLFITAFSASAAFHVGAAARAPAPSFRVGAAVRGPARSAAMRLASEPLFCLNVCLRVKPERREDFLQCICANQAATLSAEPLAVTLV